MMAYPTSGQFSEALPTLLGILGGKSALSEDAQSLWIIQGYAESILLPGPVAGEQITLGKIPELAVTPKELHTFGLIDWKSLLAKVLALLQSILGI